MSSFSDSFVTSNDPLVDSSPCLRYAEWTASLPLELQRLTEQIKQHLARLRESGPEKKVLRAKRTRGPKMANIQKMKPSRPECRQGQIYWENTTQNSKSPDFRPKS